MEYFKVCLFSLVILVLSGCCFIQPAYGYGYGFEIGAKTPSGPSFRSGKTVSHNSHNTKDLNRKPEISPKFRLPDSIQPLSYDLNILIVLDKSPSPNPNQYEPWTTQGNVTISILVKEATATIKLHKDPNLVIVKDEEIQIVKKSSGFGFNIENSAYEDEKADLWVLNLAAPLEVNETYDITMKFYGNVSETNVGLYRAKYVDQNGNDRWMALTQFAAIGFRQMIPGFDEPRFKTEFIVSVARPQELSSVSNAKLLRGNETDSNLPSGFVWDHFNTTVKLPTYLLAILVSDYKSISTDTAILGKPVEVLAPSFKIDDGWADYGVLLTAQVLKAFEQEFNQSYLETKMASVAVPQDYFHFSAMENAGMITYRETVLLYKQNVSLESDRLKTAEIISHECAHQWHGNLVTCEFFDSVWLNEGFATYMSYLGMEKVAPEYDPTNQILYNVVHEAMRVDSTFQSRPVINEVTLDDVIANSFYDAIAYEKGASLLRMMEGFLGKETLMMGIAKYLDNQKFGTAVQNDLFEAVNEVAHAKQALPKDMDISTIMNTYTLQKGIPLVRVTKAGPFQLMVSQERYRNNMNEMELKGSESDLLWEIPVTIQSGREPEFPRQYFWLHQNTSLRTFTVDTSSWIIVNQGAFGYYRTLYDPTLTSAIHQQLDTNHTLLSPLTKGQLIEDYFQFAEQEYIQYETALGMTKFLGISPSPADHTFWFPALRAFTPIHQLFQDDPVHFANLKTFLNPRLTRFVINSNQDMEVWGHGINFLQISWIFDWMSKLDSSLLKSFADVYYDAWVTMIENGGNQNPIPVDIQSAVYCDWIKRGKENATRLIRNEFHRELEPGHRNRLLAALASSQNLEQLIELILSSIQPEILDLGLTTTVLENIARNPKGQALAFGFLRDNWEKLVNLTAKDEKKIETTVISNVVSTLSLFYKTKSDLENLEKLVEDIKQNNGDHFNFISSSLTASHVQIQKNIEWFQKHGRSVSDWLAAN